MMKLSVCGAVLGFALSSFAQSSYYLYDKAEIKPYFSIGGDYRFSKVSDIQRSVLGTRYFITDDTLYAKGGAKASFSGVPITPGHGALNQGSWGVFGESDVVNLPGIHLEAGALYHQWQFGAVLSHTFFLTSMAPASFMQVNLNGYYFDTAATRPATYKLDLYNAGFSITDYSLVAGFKLKPAESALNLGLRSLVGLSQVDVIFPAAWILDYTGSTNTEAKLKYYQIDDQKYTSMGWHAGLELTPSLRMGSLELSGALGYKLTTYDRFRVTQEAKIIYLTGSDSRDLSNYYGSVRLSYILPSLNDQKAK